MNKRELIERIEGLKNLFGNKTEYIEIDTVIELVSKLHEPQKPVVPQFVADFYEDIADEFYVVLERLVLNYENNTDMLICKWFFETEDALTILINMHQFGYTVKKEKFYRVRIKGVYYNSCLIFDKINKKWFLSSIYETNHQMGSHTRKELEDAGFGWVFDCPGVEIEEVEE